MCVRARAREPPLPLPPGCAFVFTSAAAESTCTQPLSKFLLYTQAHSNFSIKTDVLAYESVKQHHSALSTHAEHALPSLNWEI